MRPPTFELGSLPRPFKSQSKCRHKNQRICDQEEEVALYLEEDTMPLVEEKLHVPGEDLRDSPQCYGDDDELPPPSDARGQYEEPHDQQCPPGRVDVIEVEPGLSVIPPPRRPPGRRRIKRSVQNRLKPAKSPGDELNNLVL